MFKEEIVTNKAPKAFGPYSQAISVGGMVFCTGQIPIDPKTNDVITGDIKKQVKQVFENLKEVLKAAGCDFHSVVKTTVFLSDMNNFTVMNDIYGKYFDKPYPARSTVQVARLPKDVLVEVECIAISNDILSSGKPEGCCGGGCMGD